MAIHSYTTHVTGIFVKLDKETKQNDKLMKSPSEVPASPRITHSENILNQESDKEFKLAPTPAQLGKAPLQRRQMGMFTINSFIYHYYYIIYCFSRQFGNKFNKCRK